MPFVTLHIVSPNGKLLKECEVNSVASMGYAAMHVTEQMGEDDEAGGLLLLDYVTGQPVPEDDMAMKWDGKRLILAQMPR